MRFFRSVVLVVVGSLLALHAWAADLELHGVKVPGQSRLAGSELQLNGAGTRTKVVFKVYVAALYLGQKASTPDAVMQQSGPKRLSVTMLRDMDAAELGKLLTRGIEDNLGQAAMSRLVPGLVRLGQIFADQKKLLAADTFVIDWLPGTGTVITVKGQVQGEPFREPEFFNALLSIWLGQQPADQALKDALLGTKKD